MQGNVQLHTEAVTPYNGRYSKVPHLYRALILEIRRHIRQRGWTMQTCDDKSGLQDGYTAKALSPDSQSGRVAHYETLDLLVEALVGSGYKLLIVPAKYDRYSRKTLVGALSEQERCEAERVARLIELRAFAPRHPSPSRAARRMMRRASVQEAASVA